MEAKCVAGKVNGPEEEWFNVATQSVCCFDIFWKNILICFIRES